MNRPQAPAGFDAAVAQEQFLTVLLAGRGGAPLRGGASAGPLGSERVALAQALGRVLADEVAAPIDVPPFDRAGVDGFAVRAADLEDAGEAAPVRLCSTAR